MTLRLLGSMIAAGFAGAIAHELAHWIVWRVTGRRPSFAVWRLVVVPRAGPSHTTPADRVAAAAPYVMGLAALLWGFSGGGILWVVFGLAAIQVPSRSDVAAMRGQVDWEIGAETTAEPSRGAD